jgi:hypothetical protein
MGGTRLHQPVRPTVPSNFAPGHPLGVDLASLYCHSNVIKSRLLVSAPHDCQALLEVSLLILGALGPVLVLPATGNLQHIPCCRKAEGATLLQKGTVARLGGYLPPNQLSFVL